MNEIKKTLYIVKGGINFVSSLFLPNIFFEWVLQKVSLAKLKLFMKSIGNVSKMFVTMKQGNIDDSVSYVYKYATS